MVTWLATSMVSATTSENAWVSAATRLTMLPVGYWS